MPLQSGSHELSTTDARLLLAAHETVSGKSQTAPTEDGFVIRLRAVRRKLSRWLPSSEAFAVWSADYVEIYGAAARLESAVKAFARLEESGVTSVGEVETLLSAVEARATEFELSIVDNFVLSH